MSLTAESPTREAELAVELGASTLNELATLLRRGALAALERGAELVCVTDAIEDVLTAAQRSIDDLAGLVR